jgi:Cdc6-like AAA superfamily ATPase
MSTNYKTSARAIDEPLVEPEGDLLDMNRHAKALADYIKQDRKLPFTVGIFGYWGEGKTTMVNFIHRHLKPPVPMTDENPPQPADGPRIPFYFVTISACPYTTSEKLWRALILEIAKKVYDVPPETNEPDKPDKPDAAAKEGRPDLFTKLSSFLHGELFPKKQSTVTRYEQLKIKLDRTDYGKISKRTPKESLDDEAVLSAVVSGTLSVLGTVSPLAAGIRSFFGVEPKLPSGKASGAASDGENPNEEIDALTNFQTIFRELIESRYGKNPVYVFIDDLDRAQPDVALDIMESIRIALSECDCVYILAVDERLIAQGLRLRYRELFAQQAELEIASKGQEYLEKIIQFRTRVPPRTPEQTQRLIAAEFSHWTPAGDIIQSIVGNNPRRVKQYCQRLSFQNMIGSPFSVNSGPAAETATDNAGPD